MGITRRRTLAKLKWHPLLNGASRMMAMFGGPLLGAGLLSLVGFGGTRGVVMTAAGAALSVLSIAVDCVGMRIGQDGSLDQTEIAAQSTARHLVKAMRSVRKKRRIVR